MKLSKLYTSLALSGLAASSLISVHAEETTEIERIVVHADFRSSELAQVPASVSVIDSMQLEDEGARHFEDVINGIANLNWAGGSSRPRYFQIRGVGERSEYQGAPNSSVGFIYDDIDLSGIGMTASLFDMEQVEVLRGPQGTRLGANALAGLIYLKSKAPTETFEHGLQLSKGQDDYTELSGYSSGAVSDELLYRVSLQSHKQNGFYDNDYLNRDDTNGRDELTGRAKLRWLAADDVTVALSLLHADFDNGYDAWTLDNNGETTLTDKPGFDSQKTQAASLKILLEQAETYDVTLLTSYAQSDTRHAYDGDWANPDYWASKTCYTYDDDWNVTGSEACVYDYWWDKEGERETLSQEVRFSSTEQGKIFGGTTAWLVGGYGMTFEESNDLTIDQEYNGWGAWRETSSSEYEATNLALFGQLDSTLSDDLALSVGLRVENRSTDYSDSAGEAFSPSETMWGGHLALFKELTQSHTGYAKVARGYKAGGFNMSLPDDLSDAKEFDQEVLYNYELGLKSALLNNRLISNLAVFYMDRQDQQVSASRQEEGSGDFWLFTTNATSSTSYGVEWDASFQATPELLVYGSLGLLDASYDDYRYEADEDEYVDLSGRDLAHAPHSTFSLGVTWLSDLGWFANLNLSGKSSFYYSDDHNQKNSAYQLVNGKVGYQAQGWSAYLWGRNLTDEDYGVRGFYFGNRPDLDWASEQYVRYGDPRQMGVTVSVDF